MGYEVPPALAFVPAPGLRGRPRASAATQASPDRVERPPPKPDTDEGLAFLPVTELSALVRSRQVTSTELTKLYLARLKRFDPLLKCVITLTEDLALKQASKADAEMAAGIYRGPLHGIPWGAKDLIAYPGYDDCALAHCDTERRSSCAPTLEPAPQNRAVRHPRQIHTPPLKVSPPVSGRRPRPVSTFP